MKLVITTQTRENYGAHDWDGQGECPQYWKYKGGCLYIVLNADPDDMSLVGTVSKYCVHSSQAYEEYIVDSSFIADDEKVGEDWDAPYILTITDSGFDVERTFTNDDYSFWKEVFKTDPNGERISGSYKLTPANAAAEKRQAEWELRQIANGATA